MRKKASTVLTRFVAGYELVMVGALVACAGGDVHHPNIVFIVVDTLRQDHLGCYGSTRDTTPSIDALAADATRF